MSAQATYDQLCAHRREAALLTSIQSVLEWDERTKLPPAAGQYRAEQVTHLAGLAHKKWTSPRLGEWLAVLMDSPLAADKHSDTGAVIHRLKRDYDKKTKLPQALVEELARLSVLGQQVWSEARQENDFAKFRPLLEKTVELKKQEATALGYDDSPYDPLLDDYEPDAKTAEVARVLEGLRQELVPLVQRIQDSDRRPNRELLARPCPRAAQESFSRAMAESVGFDFSAGRLDVSVHPFCCELGPYDTRITTRYESHSFIGATFSVLHEAGHGIYEQGLPTEQFGLPTGQAISLGIHESQSRLWENQVGRSRPFWEHFYPAAQEAFSEALAGVPLDEFFFAINEVRPSLIRVEADEVTYNLHILIRFELEVALLADQLAVADLPAAWNEKYRAYLGIDPPNDTQGVLQDVHWGAGLIGYFPTYSLGNLYGAQFFDQARLELGGLDGQFRRGEFAPLREWLRTNIYQHGRRYGAGELVERVTGKPLTHDALVRHLREKFEPLYALS